jgi:hypothetical protein
MKIRDDVNWMPAGWVFDSVLERIATELEKIDHNLSTTLLDAMADNHGIGYCDLSSLDSEQFCTLIKAMEYAYEKSIVEGSDCFYKPEYYPPFISVFGELKALLLSDPRSQSFQRQNKS